MATTAINTLGEEFIEHLVTKSDLEHALATFETRLTWQLFVAAAAIIGIIISVLRLT